jgi:alpha-tubulin suppressor-like RCC1 family protein
MAHQKALRMACALSLGFMGTVVMGSVLTGPPASGEQAPTILLTSGQNTYGELGIGNSTGPESCSGTPCTNTPMAVNLPAGVKAGQIVAANDVAYTVGSDRKLYAWGENSWGELGVDTSTGPENCSSEDYCSTTPVVVELPTAALPPTQVVTSGFATLALGANGVLYGWGDDEFGELGTGTGTAPQTCAGSRGCSTVPVVISLPDGATATDIAMAGRVGYAIGTDDVLYSWGFGSYGELGNGQSIQPGSPATEEPFPPGAVDLPSGVTPTAVYAGDYSAFTDVSGGAVYGWGYNYYDQLGGGTSSSSTCDQQENSGDCDTSVPQLVDLPSGVTVTSLVSTGFYTTYAIGSDQNLYVWGNNEADFGNGSSVTFTGVPETVTLASGVFPVAMAAWLANGYAVPSVYVVGTDGQLYEWGQDVDGEFGDGQAPPEYIATPTPAPGIADADAVAAGSSLLEVNAQYTPPFTVAGSDLTAKEDLPTTLSVADIIPAPGSSTTSSEYTATIDWGDGSTDTTGTVVTDGSFFKVQGSHTYTGTGDDTISVSVVGPPDVTETGTSAVTVTKPPKPSVKSVKPSAVRQKATTTLTVSGKNFTSSGTAQASFSNAGITVNSVTYTSASKISVNVTVSKKATTGAGNVSVTTPGGTGTCTGCLTVDARS